MRYRERISFEVNDDFKIKILLNYSLNEVFHFDDSKVFLEYEDKKILLCPYQPVKCILGDMRCHLNAAIENKLELHESIKEDIGYLSNKEMHAIFRDKKSGLFMVKDDDYEHWVGDWYCLWSYSISAAIWIYNKGNKIFFHVTPNYKWSSSNPKKWEDFISYRDFMNSYKPYFIIHIKKSDAKFLVKKLDALEKIIEANYDSTLYFDSKKSISESIEVPSSLTGPIHKRVAIEDKNYVVVSYKKKQDKDKSGPKYCSHKITWSQSTDDTKIALIRKGLVTKNGEPLKLKEKGKK